MTERQFGIADLRQQLTELRADLAAAKAELEQARTDAIKDREAFAAALLIDNQSLRAELEQAKREINARKGTQEATDQALIDEIRKHNRDRRTIRALVVAARALNKRKDGWRRVALYWRSEWRLYVESLIGDEYIKSYIRLGSKSRRSNKHAERGHAGKE